MFENVVIRKIILCILALLLFMPFSYANDLAIAQKKINKKNVHFLKDTVGYNIYTVERSAPKGRAFNTGNTGDV